MTNEELVTVLREEAGYCKAIEWDIPICTEDHIRIAADAIEELVQENEKLQVEKNDILTVLTNDMVPRRMFDNVCAQRDELKAELDAAVAEIPNHCGTCRRYWKHENCLDDAGKCGWEWRGVTDTNVRSKKESE